MPRLSRHPRALRQTRAEAAFWESRVERRRAAALQKKASEVFCSLAGALDGGFAEEVSNSVFTSSARGQFWGTA